jgi:hypothetical protein
MTATARTFTAESARTTRMRVLVIPTVAFAKPAGRETKPSHWATPPWRTGMGRHAQSRQRHRQASCLREDAEHQGQGHRITAGEEDKAYHVAYLGALNVTPHVMQNKGITRAGKSRRSGHRRTGHAPPRIWHAAIAPADDRMHRPLGYAAWHNAQNKNTASSVALRPTSRST